MEAKFPEPFLPDGTGSQTTALPTELHKLKISHPTDLYAVTKKSLNVKKLHIIGLMLVCENVK